MSEIATPRPESAQLACPECQHPITYYDVEGSEYYACPNCHAYFQWSGEETPKVLGTYQQAPKTSPVLPLGALGVLDGTLYRVVGVVSRCEANHPQYSWREYQLWQPETARYVQLAEYDGHWTLIWAASHLDQNRENFKLSDFKLFNKYQSRIDWALGEFDWDIESDKNLDVSEYINPPLLLVQEQRGREQHWYRGRHVAPAELAQAFTISQSELPDQEGTGAVQPAPGRRERTALLALTGLVVGLLVLVQLVLSLRSNSSVLNQTLQVTADTTTVASPGTGRVLVSNSFVLDHQSALNIELKATLANQWLELPVSLVNEQTGRGFEFTKNIEFYNGVEGGESWSEGSCEASADLSRVPAGRYHLNFYPFTEKGVAPEIQVTVWQDSALFSNFLLVLTLVLVYPLIQVFRLSAHERSRWENSDYNPYANDN